MTVHRVGVLKSRAGAQYTNFVRSLYKLFQINGRAGRHLVEQDHVVSEPVEITHVRDSDAAAIAVVASAGPGQAHGELRLACLGRTLQN